MRTEAISKHIQKYLRNESYGTKKHVLNIAIKYYEAPETISDYEWKFLENLGIVNNCGGEGCKICHYLSKVLLPFFIQAECRMHDFGHWLGGDDYERLRQNRGFYKRILQDIVQHQELSIIKIFCLTNIATLFFFLTNAFSYKNFNYR